MNKPFLYQDLARLLCEPPQAFGDQENQITGWRACYDLKTDFIGFAGHFPAYPLLPAFIQVCLAQHLLEQALHLPLRLTGIGMAKFTGQARPGDCLLVECRSLAGNTWDCLIRLQDAVPEDSAGQVAKFRLKFVN